MEGFFVKGEKGGELEREREINEGTNPMFIYFPTRAYSVVVFRRALCDGERRARDDDVGGICCSCPFLAVGAVAEGCDGRVAGVFVVDLAAHAGTFCHIVFFYSLFLSSSSCLILFFLLELLRERG